MRIQLWRSHRKIDDCWGVEEFKQLPTEVESNGAAVRLQMDYLLLLQRVHLAVITAMHMSNDHRYGSVECFFQAGGSGDLCVALWIIDLGRARKVTSQRQIKQQLDTIRDTDLFECPEEVVFYCMFTERQFGCNDLVGLAGRGTPHHVQFTLGQWRGLVCYSNVGRGDAFNCIQQEGRFQSARPDIALANMLDTIEKIGHWLLSREYPPCPAAKCVDNGLMRRLIQKDNSQDAGMSATDRLCQIESIPGLLTKLGADHHEVYMIGLQRAKKVGNRYSRSMTVPVSREPSREQVTAHGVAIDNQDTESMCGIILRGHWFRRPGACAEISLSQHERTSLAHPRRGH